MRKIYFSIVLLGMFACSCFQGNTAKESATDSIEKEQIVDRIHIDSLEDVVIFYPQFKTIDHVCRTMPSKQDSTVVFCCAGAFTGQYLTEFKHMNVAGNHVSEGQYRRGYRCRPNTGAFVFYNGKGQFLFKNYNQELKKAAQHKGMGFAQNMIVYNFKTQPSFRRLGSQFVYRALCQLNDDICIIESRQAIHFRDFIKALERLKVRHALYLDMGTGWNYSWYRDNQGSVHDLHTYAHPYCTNWIVFKY